MVNDHAETGPDAVESPAYLENIQIANSQREILASSSTTPNSKSFDLRFNVKITELSDLENPFVIYENKQIDDEGFIIFDNFDNYNGDLSSNPNRILPWLTNPREPLERKTLKIEVTYMTELVLLRFIHVDKLYPLKFPQIMLEIANNIT